MKILKQCSFETAARILTDADDGVSANVWKQSTVAPGKNPEPQISFFRQYHAIVVILVGKHPLCTSYRFPPSPWCRGFVRIVGRLVTVQITLHSLVPRRFIPRTLYIWYELRGRFYVFRETTRDAHARPPLVSPTANFFPTTLFSWSPRSACPIVATTTTAVCRFLSAQWSGYSAM